MTKKIKKIVSINQTFGMGGSEMLNRDLLLALRDVTKIDIAAYVTFQPFAQMLRQVHIPTTKLPIEVDVVGNWKGLVKAFFLWPFAVLQYAFIVWKSRTADVIIMSNFFEKIVVTPMAVAVKIPVVWIEYAPMTMLFEKFFGFPKFFYRLVEHLPKKIIVPTEYTKRYFIEELKYPSDRLAVVACGRYEVDPNKYKVTNPKQLVIVCASRMEQGKGQDLLVRALLSILQRFPDTTLQLTGEGGYIEVVKELVHELQLQKHVQFLGWVKDPLEVMAKASVCVFPSVWKLEGFGLVTIEAMALGKPIVAFDCGPTAEILQDKVTGLLAEAGNIEDLAKHICTMLEKPELAQKLGNAAQESFRNNYQLEQLIHQYVAVFEEAVESR
jgi:glycosyltransferase involved in cell wall biosynthesis